jgi:hypothetical protein
MPILAADLVDFTMLSEFIQLISTPSLRAVAMHWDDVRRVKRMPSWEDLQPKAIGSQLAIAWSLKYDRSNGSFTGRLAGDRIARLVGKDFRGLPLAQSQSSASFASMHPLLTRVVLEPAAFCGFGMVFKQADRLVKGERLILPLSTNGQEADGLIGATEYESSQFMPGEAVEPITDQERWFALA